MGRGSGADVAEFERGRVLWEELGGRRDEEDTLVLPWCDGYEIETYTEGQCHLLAIALHRRLGWPLYGCGWYQWGRAQFDAPSHVFVLSPAGESVDVYGPWARDAHPDPGLMAPHSEPTYEQGDDWRPISLGELERLSYPVGAFESHTTSEARATGRVATKMISALGLKRAE